MRFRRLTKRLRGRQAGRGIILLYHRIAAPDLDPQLLCVGPERFAEHLEVLRGLTFPVPLERIQQASRSGGPPPAAVTFDDGYADNLLAAAPLLEAAGIPATFFITSGLVGSDHEFWWDELERVLLTREPLPSALNLTVGERTVDFDFTSGATFDPAWNVLRQDTPSPYYAAYRILMERLRSLDPPARDAVIHDLQRWAGLSAGARPTRRALDEADLRQLDAHELVEVGAHTVGHASLASLSPTRQLEEIAGSKLRIEELLRHRVTSFSYPFGTTDDYSPTTVRAVVEAGFELACANVEGRVSPSTDRFQLPRLLVRDWDGDEFERRLRVWLGGA